MIERATLLHAAAGQIDGLDAEIGGLNDAKKDIYENVRESVSPAGFKAWRDAVKLRQRRRVDRNAIEEHDGRVQAMLAMLEGVCPEQGDETPVAPVSGPAIGVVEEPRPYARAQAQEETPPHDPVTGEIVSAPEPAVEAAADIPGMGDMPAFLVRRPKVLEAAQ